MKITLIDYGAGNVTSVERALHRLGAETQRTNSASEITNATALILPGVGHFAALIRALDDHQIRTPLLDAINRGVPFLGICLGLQALYDSSDEAPDLLGLKIFPGSVRSLPTNVKLPHMGWNQLQFTKPSRLLKGIPPQAYFYFAHSFASTTTANGEAVALCTHGTQFTAALETRNIFAVQFHPEKSGQPGAQFLQNFLALAAEAKAEPVE